MEKKSNNSPSRRLYTVEWTDNTDDSYPIQIKNKNTGSYAGFTPEEFVKGTSNFNFETDNFPKYVRKAVKELHDGYVRKLQKIADRQNKN